MSTNDEEKVLVMIDAFEGSIALGDGAQALGGEISIVGNDASVTFSRAGASCPAGEVVSTLRKIFAGSAAGFLVRSQQANLKIDAVGNVFVNGEKVGSDPEILARAIAFLLSFYVGNAQAFKVATDRQP